ncbi:2-amino-3-ketobutyrate coenzyme A ligase, mitochondrial-like [Clytia hemisphaerica]|uniref:Aminotransferase class I/classII large domain-containing protein n=1 Tax=Clytia hemisphaerica TaxID=252671 RepID=A0A7M5WTF9_9CNID|eukprot:TCONS_00030920-protein
MLKLHRRCMSAAATAQMREIVAKQLGAIKEAGTWKVERVITSPQADRITVDGTSGKLLNFCANNYLGLSSHKDVIAAAAKSLNDRGNGLSSVRFICGTQDIHIELERKIAEFHEREDTIAYISCFDANAGIFESLLTPEDAVISDELNHASIIDGIRLCKAKKYRYKHRDMQALEDSLKDAREKGARMIMIVTDGVFSMDGTVAPLKDICDLAEKYSALTFIDECHGTGVIGKTGRGTEELLNQMGRVDIINSTLGKALGGAAGGYTTGPKELTSLLRQKSRPYLFSNTLPPPVVASADKVFEMLLKGTTLIPKLAENTELFRNRMTQAGFTVSGDNHPICPVMMPDERTAIEFADQLLANGIYVIGFTYPVVPKGRARIRVQLSAVHSTEDINMCCDAFTNVGEKLGVIS